MWCIMACFAEWLRFRFMDLEIGRGDMKHPVVYKNICPKCGREVKGIFCEKCRVRPVRREVTTYKK